MRKIASILLLALLLFNWFGYQFVSSYLQHNADQKLEVRLDNDDYDVSQLIEIKVPLNMPYQSDRPEFERVDGEIEIDDVHYKYVKRKVINDSLILLCLPNEQRMRIESAKEDYFKQVNDLQAGIPKKSPSKEKANNLKSVFSDYLVIRDDWFTPTLAKSSIIYFSKSSHFLGLVCKETAEQPPDC